MKHCFKLVAIFALCLVLPKSLFAFDIPANPTGFVNDYTSTLSSEDKTALETKLSDFEKSTTNEISVVIILSLDGDNIENVAQEIFTKWGIGKKDKNNGALFLIAVSDRKMRIHTGYGLEGTLTDIGTSYILSEIVAPAFMEGDYALGINGAVDKMITLINVTDTVPDNYFEVTQPEDSKQWSPSIDAIFFFIIIFQWVIAILARSKSWWAGGVVGVVIGIIILSATTLIIGIIASVVLGGIGLLLDYFVSKRYQADKALGRKSPWFIGGGGFGSGGGGFGGFGGGSSGGGGSSSSW
jgi:uncharacterized protein